MRWLTNLTLFPLLVLGDGSAGALEEMCQQVMAVGYFSDDQDNRGGCGAGYRWHCRRRWRRAWI
jgi:hypothetical protein